jgi:hypothetical protein
MRRVASVIAGAAAAAVGGLVLGEYPFTGWTPWVAGVLFALVVTEVMITIGRRHGPVVAVGGGVFSAGGLGWAVWISSGRGLEPIPRGGWIAIVLGFVVAMARGLLPVARTAQASLSAPAADDSPTALERLDEFIAPPATTRSILSSGRIVPSEPATRSAEVPSPAPPAAGPGPAFDTATAGPARPSSPVRTEAASPTAPQTTRRSPAGKAAPTTKRSPAKATTASKQAAATKTPARAKKASPVTKTSAAGKGSPANKAAPPKRATNSGAASAGTRASAGKRASAARAASAGNRAAKRAGAVPVRKAAAARAAKSPAPRSRNGGR